MSASNRFFPFLVSAKIKNIISTEEAKAKLLAEQRNKKKDSGTSFVPTNIAVNYVQHNRCKCTSISELPALFILSHLLSAHESRSVPKIIYLLPYITKIKSFSIYLFSSSLSWGCKRSPETTPKRRTQSQATTSRRHWEAITWEWDHILFC